MEGFAGQVLGSGREPKTIGKNVSTSAAKKIKSGDREPGLEKNETSQKWFAT